MSIKLLAVCVLVASAGALVFAEAGPDVPPAGRGLLTHSVTVTVDSVGTSQTALANTYDARGNLLVSVRTFDWENDSIVNSSTTVTSTYNAGGKVASAITANDFDGDGVVETYLTETYSYDPRGNVLVLSPRPTAMPMASSTLDGGLPPRTMPRRNYWTKDLNRILTITVSLRV